MVDKIFRIFDVFKFIGFCFRAIKRGIKKGKSDAVLIDNIKRFDDAN